MKGLSKGRYDETFAGEDVVGPNLPMYTLMHYHSKRINSI